jgi:cytoskeletal protein RodZ
MDPGPADFAQRLAAFSTWLARERELRGVGRDAVLRATRLAPAVVEALEAGEPDRLPPRAYLVGYLRAYAAAVGLDPDEVVLRYEEAAGGEVPGSPGARRSRLVPLVAAAVLIALAAAGLIGWWVFLRG